MADLVWSSEAITCEAGLAVADLVWSSEAITCEAGLAVGDLVWSSEAITCEAGLAVGDLVWSSEAITCEAGLAVADLVWSSEDITCEAGLAVGDLVWSSEAITCEAGLAVADLVWSSEDITCEAGLAVGDLVWSSEAITCEAGLAVADLVWSSEDITCEAGLAVSGQSGHGVEDLLAGVVLRQRQERGHEMTPVLVPDSLQESHPATNTVQVDRWTVDTHPVSFSKFFHRCVSGYKGSTQEICICLNVSKGTSGPPQKLHVLISPCLPGQAGKQPFVYSHCSCQTFKARWAEVAGLESVANWYSICGRLLLQDFINNVSLKLISVIAS